MLNERLFYVSLSGMEGSSSHSRDFLITKLFGYAANGGEYFNSFITHSAEGGVVPRPEIKAYPALKNRPACEYHNYKPLGVSFCFENSILKAAHVYNGTHGFSVYKGDLPLGLRLNMKGQDIVRILGEPDDKMGGGRGGPISLAYKDKGMQINFIGSNWEDRDNEVDSITIHEPVET